MFFKSVIRCQWRGNGGGRRNLAATPPTPAPHGIFTRLEKFRNFNKNIYQRDRRRTIALFWISRRLWINRLAEERRRFCFSYVSHRFRRSALSNQNDIDFGKNNSIGSLIFVFLRKKSMYEQHITIFVQRSQKTFTSYSATFTV